MRKGLFVFIYFLLQNICSFAQPAIEWQKCLGGTNWDQPTNTLPSKDMIQQTVDGGFIILASTSSNNGDVSGFHGGSGDDYWAVKTDASGNIQWQKCLGGTSSELASSIQQTSDGGYIISGTTFSNDGDVTGFHGESDYWIVKLDSSGILQWQKCLGGGYIGNPVSGYDKALSVKQTLDGGFIAIGGSNSMNGNVTGLHVANWYYSDFWIVKLNSVGTLQWQKCLGGYLDEVAHSVVLSNDSGFVIAGYTRSNDGDVTGNYDSIGYSEDYWVVKLNSLGNIIWQKCYGGSKDDSPASISKTSDGGYIIAGQTSSYDGDVIGKYDTLSEVGWVIKIDSIGNLQWQKLLSGIVQSAIQTQDGGFLISGDIAPNDSNAYLSRFEKYWMIKLDNNYNFQWNTCDGYQNGGSCSSAIQTSDGKYVFLGSVFNNGGDVSGVHGGKDVWMVKLSDINILKNKQREVCSLCNGALSVSVYGGTYPYSYLWNTGATSDSIENLCNGTYIVTVTDASGNIGFCSEIIINDTVKVYGTQIPASCWYCPDGSATLHPSGGSGVYYYSWQGFSDTTATLSGLPHGWVYGCVTDSLGCIACDSIDVFSPVGIDEINNESEYIHIFPNPTSTRINLQIPIHFGQPKLIEVYSSIGELILTNGNSLELDLIKFQEGIYFIVVTNERGGKLKAVAVKI
jgi:hypothetical protein